MEWTDQPDLKQQIAATIAYVETQSLHAAGAMGSPR
jgi:hypothetical protein